MEKAAGILELGHLLDEMRRYDAPLGAIERYAGDDGTDWFLPLAFLIFLLLYIVIPTD